MNTILRTLLIASAIVVLIFVVRKIRKAQFSTKDALFWILLSVCLVLAAIFPQIVYFFSSQFGFLSPSNFVFLAVIALLVIRLFSLQAEVARMRVQLTEISQEVAILNQKTVKPKN